MMFHIWVMLMGLMAGAVLTKVVSDVRLELKMRTKRPGWSREVNN